jgi:hypothetical protein
MLPETRKLLAMLQMRSATSEDMVVWAVSMLEADVDSKNLRILASLSKPLYSSEVEDYFQRSFKDLGWSFPKPEEVLRLYACDVAEGILSNMLPAVEGCREMYRVARALDYPSDMHVWIYLDDELDAVTYENLSGVELEDVIQREAKAFTESCVVHPSARPTSDCSATP